ncbi:MAG: CpsD/CapB family tyrosine-protein kinase [Desulfatitalea sp.]|nr:CpsD/CapB family tyrosine-protein kinase [Desulfatitalea sp.]
MGKIFDALEKADKQKPAFKTLSHAENSNQRQSAKDNVVALVNTKQSATNAKGYDRLLVAYHEPQSSASDLFKVLKTNIFFPKSGPVARTILVTSPVSGDGKSFISANLAVSIAQGIEEHVLLVDCDMRRSSINRLFGLGHTPGLSDYLVSEKGLANYLVKPSIEKLTILPSGNAPTNSVELLAASKMKGLIAEVKRRYDDRFVIIDSPPPSIAPETHAISKYVDGVLIVVRSRQTPRNAVFDLVEQVGKEKILGIVLNHCEQSTKKYYGYTK